MQPSIKGMFDCNRMQNSEVDFNAEIAVFGFSFHHSIGRSEKGFEKLSLRTAIFHSHA